MIHRGPANYLPVRSDAEREYLRNSKRHAADVHRLTAALVLAAVGAVLVLAVLVQPRPAASVTWLAVLCVGGLLWLPLLVYVTNRRHRL